MVAKREIRYKILIKKPEREIPLCRSRGRLYDAIEKGY
jgi:hypothetical protein